MKTVTEAMPKKQIKNLDRALDKEFNQALENPTFQELVSKLSESQKKQLLQSARKKYDELQKKENLHGSIKNIKEVIQFLFNEDISKVQIEKDSELDK